MAGLTGRATPARPGRARRGPGRQRPRIQREGLRGTDVTGLAARAPGLDSPSGCPDPVPWGQRVPCQPSIQTETDGGHEAPPAPSSPLLVQATGPPPGPTTSQRPRASRCVGVRASTFGRRGFGRGPGSVPSWPPELPVPPPSCALDLGPVPDTTVLNRGGQQPARPPSRGHVHLREPWRASPWAGQAWRGRPRQATSGLPETAGRWSSPGPGALALPPRAPPACHPHPGTPGPSSGGPEGGRDVVATWLRRPWLRAKRSQQGRARHVGATHGGLRGPAAPARPPSRLIPVAGGAQVTPFHPDPVPGDLADQRHRMLRDGHMTTLRPLTGRPAGGQA